MLYNFPMINFLYFIAYFINMLYNMDSEKVNTYLFTNKIYILIK